MSSGVMPHGMMSLVSKLFCRNGPGHETAPRACFAPDVPVAGCILAPSVVLGSGAAPGAAPGAVSPTTSSVGTWATGVRGARDAEVAASPSSQCSGSGGLPMFGEQARSVVSYEWVYEDGEVLEPLEQFMMSMDPDILEMLRAMESNDDALQTVQSDADASESLKRDEKACGASQGGDDLLDTCNSEYTEDLFSDSDDEVVMSCFLLQVFFRAALLESDTALPLQDCLSGPLRSYLARIAQEGAHDCPKQADLQHPELEQHAYQQPKFQKPASQQPANKSQQPAIKSRAPGKQRPSEVLTPVSYKDMLVTTKKRKLRVESTDGHEQSDKSKVECPLCGKMFKKHGMPNHLHGCRRRVERDGPACTWRASKEARV